jgi:hypothetical protein
VVNDAVKVDVYDHVKVMLNRELRRPRRFDL